MTESAVIDVAAALIQDGDGRYLLTRRRRGTHLEGLWEFPGGKREPDESIEACLRRELAEELAASFEVGEQIDTVRWVYPEKTVVLHFHRCRLASGTIVPCEGQEMAWVEAARLGEYEFPAADHAIVERLRGPREAS